VQRNDLPASVVFAMTGTTICATFCTQFVRLYALLAAGRDTRS
jgi:hypothetical protein